MANFATDEILEIWYSRLVQRFSNKCRLINREHKYIDKNFPFRAINMGKKNDEYFLDTQNEKIPVEYLLNNLNLLIIKDFQDDCDLSLENKQAKKATSKADIFIEHASMQIIIELEVFKDKPFSNLIFIPELCKSDCKIPLYFIHCFAPERLDKEAELTRKIGSWLQGLKSIDNFEYMALMLPSLPESMKYLLPRKNVKKPTSYLSNEDEIGFKKYITEFCEDRIIPMVLHYLEYSR